MIIEFVNIEISSVSGTGGKTGYSKGKVNFLDEGGRARSKTMMSFANPKVFSIFQSAQEGQRFEITEKQQGEFTNWQAAELITGEAPNPPKAGTSTAKPTTGVSQYETRDERNARQMLIVRQSSLTAATAALTPGAKGALDPDAVEALAERYAAFVYQQPLQGTLAEEPNDIPY